MIRVLHMIGSLNIGGSQAMIMSLYRKINRNKVQFDFIIDHPDQIFFAKEVKSLGGKIYFMPTFKGKNILQIKKAWELFFKEHPEYKILHIHIRSYASIFIPIAKKYNVVTIIHSHSTSNGKGLSAIIKNIMQYPLRFQADYFMACSDKAGKWLFGTKVLLDKKYMIVPNAIDSNKFSFSLDIRNKIRKKLNVSNAFIVGHVGRMAEPKNHIFLIEVFIKILQKRKDAILLLIGDGELRTKIEKIIQKNEISEKVIILGDRSNVHEYYQAMDIFLFPSLWEGLGIATIEAQASGLPCIISDMVPHEVKICTDLVKFVSLEKGAKYWANIALNSIIKNRIGRAEDISHAGYDIFYNADKLQNFYVRLL